MLMTYAEQLKLLALEKHVDLQDMVRHAGLPSNLYLRSIVGPHALTQAKAEAIAAAIKEMDAR